MIELVRRADHLRHVQSLPDAAAWIGLKSAQSRQRLDVEGQEAAGRIERQARDPDRFTRMGIAQERLEPIRLKPDRSAQQHRDRHHSELIGIGMQFQAERAADVGADNTHLVIGQTQQVREHLAHLERRLMRYVHGEFARQRRE